MVGRSEEDCQMWLYIQTWHSVNQFDGRNLLWRSVIRYGTSKIWYWPFLMTRAMARLQILDDVSKLIQTRMRSLM